MYRTDITKDETGNTHGKWLVLHRIDPPEGKSKRVAWWLCECQCEKKIRRAVRGSSLRDGESLSCGCERLGQRNPDAPFCAVLRSFKEGAIRRNIPFELTLTDIKALVTQNCHYCGCKPANAKGNLVKRYNFYSTGIDRVDNSRGYEIDNVVPCCFICNNAKHQMPVDDFLSWVERIYKHSFKDKS